MDLQADFSDDGFDSKDSKLKNFLLKGLADAAGSYLAATGRAPSNRTHIPPAVDMMHPDYTNYKATMSRNSSDVDSEVDNIDPPPSGESPPHELSGDDVSSSDDEGPTSNKSSRRKARRRKREAEEKKKERDQYNVPTTPAGGERGGERSPHPKLRDKEDADKLSAKVVPVDDSIIRDSLGYGHTAIGVAVNKWLSDVAFDTANRDKLVAKMDSPVAQVYTEEEENAETEGLAMISIFRFSGLMNSTSLKIDNSSILMNENFYNGHKGDVYGRVTAMVPCSSPQHVAAYLFNDFARSKSQDKERAKLRMLIAEPNDHSCVTRRVKHVPVKGVADREFLNVMLWRKVSDDEMRVVFFPIEHDSVEPNPHLVRSTGFTIITLCKHGSNTLAAMHYHFNLNGLLPVHITHNIGPTYMHNSIIEAVEYFQNLRPCRNLNEQDGKNMGEVLMSRVMKASKDSGWKHRVANIEEVIDTFYVENDGLRTFIELNPSFDGFFQTIITNKLRPRSTVNLALASLSRPDAQGIAASLPIAVLTNVDGSAAVDEWISNYPSLKELDKSQKWFRPMILAIGFRLLRDSDYGLKVRVTVGAVLSIFDMGSDIVVIWTFFQEGQRWFAWASIAMIFLSLFLQVVNVLSCNKDMPAWTKVRESLIVVFLVKPGVDAYRIATGAEPDERCTMSPLQESSYSRGIEMVAESIPASVLQGMAFLTSARRTRSKAISIGISLMTTAYNATLISYDLDTSPRKRREDPDYFGYVRNDKRTQVLIQVWACSVLLVSNKVLATALLAIIEPRWVVNYMSADMGLFFLYKVVTGDFLYALPLSNFGVHAAASFFCRVFAKVLADYTGFFHGRTPLELGGRYFMVNMIMSHISCFVAVWAYDNYFEPEVTGINEKTGEEEIETAKISTSFLYSVVGGGALMWSIIFIWFMLTMDRKYVKTFYSTKTGSQYIIENFRNAKTDKVKIAIFRRSIRIWRPIIGEVRMWVNGNFQRWETEKPDFFTKKFIQKIPDEVFSDADIARLKNQGLRRKSSIIDEITGR